MKTKIGILVLALCAAFLHLPAQQRYSARAASNDISDNLDLEAVASIFGDCENLEDFEHRLNDPDERISNLDLNQDGYIDYLRVIENSSDRNSLVIVQAVLDKDVYQDVATIEIERNQNGLHHIQIVGDPYLYGSDYIIEPVFVHTPLIFSFFWGPRYNPWRSPYYWNYYPRWYSYYRPFSPFRYHRHVHGHINFANRYNYTTIRNSHFGYENYNRIRRNDYETRYPDRAFNNRHQGITNRNELIERRSNRSGEVIRNSESQRSNRWTRPESRNSGDERNNKRISNNENRRSDNQSSPDQTRTRENRNRSYDNRSNPTPQVNNPQRPATRTESIKSYPDQVQKQRRIEGPVRPTREARIKQRVERKAEPKKQEDKKVTREERRRE